MVKHAYDEVVDLILVRMDESDARGKETVQLLRQLNGHVREHGQLLAAHGQWIESHEKAHDAIDKRVDHISLKANIMAGATAVMSLVAGVLGLAPE